MSGPIGPIETNDSDRQVPDLFFKQERDDASEEERLTNLDEYERTWYELQIDSLSGRHSGS